MHRLRSWKIAKVTFSSLVALAIVLTGVIGFAHTKSGRPLLAWMGKHGIMPGAKGAGCPLGYDKLATPEQKQAARKQFAANHASNDVASARPALGFVLDRTTRDDVKAWAAKSGVTCVDGIKYADLDCSNVPVSALPAPVGTLGIHGIWFNFDAGERLVSVHAFRYANDADTAAAAFRAVEDGVTSEAGPPAKTEGSGTPKELELGTLAQVSAEYRFKNYFAVARATNMGKSFTLSEDYRSLTN
jgi:hypothetical protein